MSTQKKLLTEADLTFTRAVEIAEGMEAAEASTQQFSKGGAAAVHKVDQKGDPCYRCGRSNHTSDECRFKDATCHACEKKGHLASVCQSRKQGQERQAQKKRYRKFHRAKWVQVNLDINGKNVRWRSTPVLQSP